MNGVNLLDERGRLVDLMTRTEAEQLAHDIAQALNGAGRVVLPWPYVPPYPLWRRLVDAWRSFRMRRQPMTVDLLEAARARVQRVLAEGER